MNEHNNISSISISRSSSGTTHFPYLNETLRVIISAVLETADRQRQTFAYLGPAGPFQRVSRLTIVPTRREMEFCQNWENNKKKHILLFIIGKMFKEFIYLHNLGNYLEKNGPEICTGGHLFNIIIGELMFVYFFGGDGGLYCRQWVLCRQCVLVFKSNFMKCRSFFSL